MGDAPHAANRVEVICGLSGAGKTTTALQRYARQVRAQGEDTALLILPTARVVREARTRLVEGDLAPGLLDPRIFTFPDLARLILNANHECATAVSPATQRLLLRDAIGGLASAGALPELSEVSRLPGFATALGELIGDLKRAAVRPRQLCAAIRQARLDRPRHREIGGLYCAYQWLLICLRSFDDEGLFWWACDVLRDRRRRPLERVELMIVDGFTDFTTTQLHMLRLLAAGIPETIVTLDHSLDDAREGLAPWFRDTRRRLAMHLGGLGITRLPADQETGPLAHLRANLFTPGAVERADAQKRVHLLWCPNRSREVREVLARAKGLLAAGTARPGDIAVVCREVGERAAEIRHVADRMGLPVAVEAPEPPLASPAVRAVFHAYRTVAEGYRREDVLALLRSTCFTFEPLERRGLTAEDVAQVAEKALVIEGREQWLGRMGAYRDRLASRNEAALAETAAKAADAMEEAFALLPDPRATSPLGRRVVELRAFAEHTQLWRNVARADLAPHASANLRALGRLDRALNELEHARVGGAPGTSVTAFSELLREAVEGTPDEARPLAGDRLSVLDAGHVRQRRFPIVFVIGLTEGEFPRQAREEPFFSGPELERLGDAGVVLERRRGPEAYEPLLFHGAISAAERELWLSCPSADAQGKPLQPSHYLREVQRLFLEGSLDTEKIPLSQTVAVSERVADPRELADRAFFDLAAPPAEASAVAYNALVRATGSRELLPRVLWAARLEEDRDSAQPSGPYVGALDEEGIIGDLRVRFGSNYRFSAGELSAYAQCPFDCLCQYVLRLTEPEYATAAVEPRAAGIIRHDVLAQFARRRMSSRPGAPLIAPGEEEEALAELREIIVMRFRAAVRRGEVADEALWAVERERCRRDMALWVYEEAQTFGAQSPIRAEFAFGRDEGRPVRLPRREDVLVTGRLDRANLLASGAVAPGFVLIDYKSGTLPGRSDIREGRDIQFPLYTIGAEAEIAELAGGACVGWTYCRVSRPLGRTEIVGAETIESIRAALEPALAGHVDGVRAGRFSYVDVAKCARHCASADICRRQPWRRRNGSDEADTSGAA